jgi:hypothetical protein
MNNLKSSGTYKFETVEKSKKSGTTNLVGRIRAAKNLRNIIMTPAIADESSFGYRTQVKIDSLKLLTETDEEGRFEINNIKPGCYTISFFDYEGGIRTNELCVDSNFTTNINLFVQLDIRNNNIQTRDRYFSNPWAPHRH